MAAWARPLLRESVMSGRLARYKDFAWFVAKYGRADFVTKAMAGNDAAVSDPAAAGGFWMAWTILAGDVRKTRTR